MPVHDDRTWFEFLLLEGAQAGLSWETILRKREAYRKAFDDFAAERVARYTGARIERLLLDPGIVRNRLKVESAVRNAKAFLAVQREFGSFDAYVWRFVGGSPLVNRRRTHEGRPHPYHGIGCAEPRLARARVQVRRVHHLLRVHAGHGVGERSHAGLLSL